MAQATNPSQNAKAEWGATDPVLLEYAALHLIHHALASGDRHRYESIPFDFDWMCCRLDCLGASHLADECRAVEDYVSGSVEVTYVLTSVAALVGTSRTRLAMHLLLRIPHDPDSRLLARLRSAAMLEALPVKPLRASLSQSDRPGPRDQEAVEYVIRPSDLGSVSDIDYLAASPNQRFVLGNTQHLLDRQNRHISKLSYGFYADLFVPLDDGERVVVSVLRRRLEGRFQAKNKGDKQLIAGLWSGLGGFRPFDLPEDSDIIAVSVAGSAPRAVLLCSTGRVFVVDLNLMSAVLTLNCRPRKAVDFGVVDAERVRYCLAEMVDDRLKLSVFGPGPSDERSAISAPFSDLILTWSGREFPGNNSVRDFDPDQIPSEFESYDAFEISRNIFTMYVSPSSRWCIMRSCTHVHVFERREDRLELSGSVFLFPNDDGGELAHFYFTSDDQRLLIVGGSDRPYVFAVHEIILDPLSHRIVRYLELHVIGDVLFLDDGRQIAICMGPNFHFFDTFASPEESLAQDPWADSPYYLGFGPNRIALLVDGAGRHFRLHEEDGYRQRSEINLSNIGSTMQPALVDRGRRAGRLTRDNRLMYLDSNSVLWLEEESGFYQIFRIGGAGLHAFEIDPSSRFLLLYQLNQESGANGLAAAVIDLSTDLVCLQTHGTGVSAAALGVAPGAGYPFYALGYSGGDDRLIGFEVGKTDWPEDRTQAPAFYAVQFDQGLTTQPVGTVNSLAMTPDGLRCLMLCGMDRLLIFDIDAVTRRVVTTHFIYLKKGIEDGNSVCVSDDGKRAAAHVLPGQVLVFDLIRFVVVEEIRLDRNLPRTSLMSCVAMSGDGRRLLVADDSGTIHAFALALPE
jgi:hypothetical protein